MTAQPRSIAGRAAWQRRGRTASLCSVVALLCAFTVVFASGKTALYKPSQNKLARPLLRLIWIHKFTAALAFQHTKQHFVGWQPCKTASGHTAGQAHVAAQVKNADRLQDKTITPQVGKPLVNCKCCRATTPQSTLCRAHMRR